MLPSRGLLVEDGEALNFQKVEAPVGDCVESAVEEGKAVALKFHCGKCGGGG